MTFTSAATWQEGDGKKGRVGRDGTFPEHSARAGCVGRESSLSVGNFSDLSRGGQVLPKLCFFTPQRVTARGTGEGSRAPARFSCNLAHTVVLDTLLLRTVRMLATKVPCAARLAWPAWRDCLHSGGVDRSPAGMRLVEKSRKAWPRAGENGLVMGEGPEGRRCHVVNPSHLANLNSIW